MERLSKLRPPLTSAQQSLAARCYPIAVRAARGLARAGVAGESYEDLLSVAHEAILAAVTGYDEAKGPLENYVWLRVRGAVLNARAASTRWHQSVERGIDDLALGVEDTSDVFNDSDDSLRAKFADVCDGAVATLAASIGGRAWHTRGEDSVVLKEEYARTLKQTHDEIADLPPHLAQLLEMRYFREQTIEEVAAATGLSPQKAARQLAEAMRLLRARLKGRGITHAPRV